MSIRTHHVVPFVVAGVIAAVLSAPHASAGPATPSPVPGTCGDPPVRQAYVCDANDPSAPPAPQTCDGPPVYFAVVCVPPNAGS